MITKLNQKYTEPNQAFLPLYVRRLYFRIKSAIMMTVEQA